MTDGMFMVMVIFWLALLVLCPLAACERDRNPILWFFVGLVFSPFIALIYLGFLGENKIASS